MPRTRIAKLHITGHHQLADVHLDFTHPKTGEPVDRVCFIGSNGTGKSTLLRLLQDQAVGDRLGTLPPGAGFAAVWRHGEAWVLRIHGAERARYQVPHPDIDLRALALAGTTGHAESALADAGARKWRGPGLTPPRDLLVACPAESVSNDAMQLGAMPSTTMDVALREGASERFVHTVADDAVRAMWARLVYLVKKRESDRQDFELRPENLEKTKAQLLREFDELSPPVLTALARLWDDILAQAGLELAVDDARVPVQLNDNLELWVRSRRTGERVSYGALSTGMRRFLFRIGHLFLLYFGRDVESGMLLVDEPENSLYPDFLFTLMDAYDRVVQRPDGTTSTQSFFATHSPIVAAQFEPHERVVLEWADEGVVRARRGTAPVGDDPNDVLRKDFQLAELMGPAGVEQWHTYLRLRDELRTAAPADKPALLARAAEIAGAYGFEPPRP